MGVHRWRRTEGRRVSIPNIGQIWGVVAVDGKQGKLAVVGGKRKVHFVTLSADLELQQHTTKDMPLEAAWISLSGQRQLIVGEWNENKEFAVLPADGDGPVTTVLADVPGGGWLWRIVQTQAGYVACNGLNECVHFTDRGGRVVHVSTDCGRPRRPAVTSWGHVLIADHLCHEIKVFSEAGDYLGRLQDNSRQIEYPHYIHIDEAEGLLYLACDSPRGASELRKYRFTAGELPPLPITRPVTKMTRTPNLTDVHYCYYYYYYYYYYKNRKGVRLALTWDKTIEIT